MSYRNPQKPQGGRGHCEKERLGISALSIAEATKPWLGRKSACHVIPNTVNFGVLRDAFQILTCTWIKRGSCETHRLWEFPQWSTGYDSRLPLQGAQVQSPVGELRFHVPHGQNKTKQKTDSESGGLGWGLSLHFSGSSQVMPMRLVQGTYTGE